jgi:hypothetical protein
MIPGGFGIFLIDLRILSLIRQPTNPMFNPPDSKSLVVVVSNTTEWTRPIFCAGKVRWTRWFSMNIIEHSQPFPFGKKCSDIFF